SNTYEEMHMSNKSKLKVLIAGAGLGGLTAALALLKKGLQVQVLEQASQLGEVGAGIQLSANANRVLYGLGLEQQLLSVANPAAGKRIRLWNTGQTWPLFDLGSESVKRYGFPYFTIYRADLHRILTEAVTALDPDAIRVNHKVVNVSQDSHGVTAHMADGSTVKGDVLVGADGVHSNVRAALFGDDNPVF